ncbi:MAG: HAD superfamily hydrolase (TIGR01509 family) [Candidatus Azotimanducaceae bacterium]|jgi:HAD superfamily hydrolase (TIGR01509 family)
MPLVVFDCDGVLVDSETIYIACELEFLSRHGLDFDRQDYLGIFLGMAPKEWQRTMRALFLERLGKNVDGDFFEELNSFTLERFEEELEPVQGARAAIEGISLPMCVASSSSPSRLKWKLTHTGLVDLFGDNLFPTDLVEYGKPAPDLFLFAAKAMQHLPGDCVVVEDSANGVLAAKRAGMRVIGFTAANHCIDGHGATLGEAGADAVVQTYGELNLAITNLLN